MKGASDPEMISFRMEFVSSRLSTFFSLSKALNCLSRASATWNTAIWLRSILAVLYFAKRLPPKAYTFAVIPLIKPIEKLFIKIVKDKDEEKKQKALKYIANKNLLNTPSAALIAVKNEIIDMNDLAYENLQRGYKEIVYQDKSEEKLLMEIEEAIDYKNNAITQYLIELTNRVDNEDKALVGIYFHVINDIERIGDHAYNFYENSLKMEEEDLHFSDIAKGEFQQMYNVIEKMFIIAKQSLIDSKTYQSKELEELEEEIGKLKAANSTAHYNRIITNTCHVEVSPFYSTFISELERVADHLMNVGYSFINPTGDEIVDQ